MGFDALYQLLLTTEPSNETCRPQLMATRRLAAMPAFMTSLRLTYDNSGAFKPLLKKKVRVLIDRLSSKPLTGTRGEMRPLVVHVVEKLSIYTHHQDPNCRRWAEICRDIREDPESLEVLCLIADDQPELYAMVRATLSWLVSECNRHGAPMMPLPA